MKNMEQIKEHYGWKEQDIMENKSLAWHQVMQRLISKKPTQNSSTLMKYDYNSTVTNKNIL